MKKQPGTYVKIKINYDFLLLSNLYEIPSIFSRKF